MVPQQLPQDSSMGCGASIPAVLAPQQPPTGAYLFGTATGGGEATFTLPE